MNSSSIYITVVRTHARRGHKQHCFDELGDTMECNTKLQKKTFPAKEFHQRSKDKKKMPIRYISLYFESSIYTYVQKKCI